MKVPTTWLDNAKYIYPIAGSCYVPQVAAPCPVRADIAGTCISTPLVPQGGKEGLPEAALGCCSLCIKWGGQKSPSCKYLCQVRVLGQHGRCTLRIWEMLQILFMALYWWKHSFVSCGVCCSSDVVLEENQKGSWSCTELIPECLYESINLFMIYN